MSVRGNSVAMALKSTGGSVPGIEEAAAVAADQLEKSFWQPSVWAS